MKISKIKHQITKIRVGIYPLFLFLHPRSRAIASRGLPSFNVVTVLTVLVSI